MGGSRAPLPLQAEVQDEDKVWLALSYFGPLAVIPLLVPSVPGYVRMHARQGITLFLLFMLTVVLSLVPAAGPIIWAIGTLVYVVTTVVALSRAVRGRYWRAPLAAWIIERFVDPNQGLPRR